MGSSVIASRAYDRREGHCSRCQQLHRGRLAIHDQLLLGEMIDKTILAKQPEIVARGLKIAREPVYPGPQRTRKMKLFELGAFTLKEELVGTSEGMKTCQDYGRVFGENLNVKRL